MARRDDFDDGQSDSDEEYEYEMGQIDEEELANRRDFTADDRGDDFDTYEPPPRSRSELTPRGTPGVPSRRASGVSAPNPDSPDFDNFDPAAYVRKRRGVSGDLPLPSERDSYREAPRRRGYDRDREEDESEVPLGAVGGLGRYLTPETMPIIGGFAEQLGPLFRWVVYGFGCLLIFALIGCGVVVYTIVTAFRH